MECDIIRDLLPLYAEKMVSAKSSEAVEEHLGECADCRRIYENMLMPAPSVQFQTQPQKSFRKYVRKKKWSYGLKVALGTIAAVTVIMVLRLALVGGLTVFLGLEGRAAQIEVDTDVSHYLQYMGETAETKYQNKLGMDESIFPGEITEDMDVVDYKMVYYDPWDRQYLSYLVVEYADAAYDAEVGRLGNCVFDAYTGFYGAEGFEQTYDLLAIDIDDANYHGLVYALAGENNQIIYVEILFCNYFMDLDYTEYIDNSYLPVGFDAARGNAQREEIMGKK